MSSKTKIVLRSVFLYFIVTGAIGISHYLVFLKKRILNLEDFWDAFFNEDVFYLFFVIVVFKIFDIYSKVD